ncbi:SHD1 domain-containing protein [Luteolibacter sp. SL250]|uniref:SHD1 domain-containing protein n=1 Tax=Luteolibacter sp. SL250 TaxID=2995170 RepID=UPI00226F1185|nr:SHD1 domain-containing protein [Luteolibacter sp. SL250]WAC20410.1 SHD1 domain-containing protein [Luteolibacter sp. SL250]
MKFHLIAGLGLLLCSLSATAAPREWTDQATGRKVTGEFVSLDGDQVTLSINGKEYKMPVAKLSADDQAFLKVVGEMPAPAPAAAPQPAPAAVGKAQRVDITQKAYADWNGYYSGLFGKKLLKFYEKSKGIVDVPDKDTMTTVETAVMWQKDDKLGKMILFVPPDYDGSTAYGVLVYISPGNDPVSLVPGWDKVFTEKKLIYCSPAGTGNDQADMRRIALALDAVATVKASYKVDPARLIASGTSGGGAISTTIAVHYPEFKAIDCSRGSEPDGVTVFPYLDSGDIRQVAKQKKRFAWVSGPKDRNYEYIKRGVAGWSDAGVESKLFEDPNQGHAAATEDLMRQALTWIEEPPTK